MRQKGRLALAAAAILFAGSVCAQWCELNCALLGCSERPASVAVNHSVPAKHCHSHHQSPEQETIPINHHSAPECHHQHSLVAAVLPAGDEFGLGMNSPAHEVARLGRPFSTWHEGSTAATARGAPPGPPTTRGVGTPVLRI